MTKQEKFEQAYAEAHGMAVETFQAYRMGDTYRLPMIAKCWRFWNMAIDSVAVELSPYISYDRDLCIESIEAAGLRVVS